MLRTAKEKDVASFMMFDYAYGGNLNKWAQLCNTIRLRLAMSLVFADGSEQSLQLSTQPAVSFNRTKLIVKFYNPVAGQTDLNFNKQEVKKYFFSDEATGVASITNDKDAMSVQGNRIVVRGAKGAVGVFRTDGTQVQTVVKTDGDTVVIELDNLANGTYIVRAGKNVVKIAKN